MDKKNRICSPKTALKIGGIILATYALTGIAMSEFAFAILIINKVFMHGSKAEFLKFTSLGFPIAFALVGAIKALIFLIKWYFNKPQRIF